MSIKIIWRFAKVVMEPVGGLIDESVGLGARVFAIATDNVDDADDWSDAARVNSKKFRKGVEALAGIGGGAASGGAASGGDESESE